MHERAFWHDDLSVLNVLSENIHTKLEAADFRKLLKTYYFSQTKLLMFVDFSSFFKFLYWLMFCVLLLVRTKQSADDEDDDDDDDVINW